MSDYAKTINELVEYLNVCRDEYYNNNRSIISDEQYDKLFDELNSLESESGIILSNSPTQTVGYSVKSELEKVEHAYPLLSLDKTKKYSDALKFCIGKDIIFMYKVDGLTCQLTYNDGELVIAETRGDGFVGEDITHNALTFIGVPKTIPNKGVVRITGEAVINRLDFSYINNSMNDMYKNPRNLASGSVRQLDSSICAKRKVRFIVWNANDLSTNNSMLEGLMNASKIGFNIVHLTQCKNISSEKELETIFNNIRNHTKVDYIPIDGIVMMYNDIEYGKSLGNTSHHFRNGLAFKFYDDSYSTTLNTVEFTIGKTGVLTPTAVFDPVDIDGTTITRASVHNISILSQLNLCENDDIEVYKANEIIPQIKVNNTKHIDPSAYRRLIPTLCPYCNSKTEVRKNNDSDVFNLYCTNSNCCGVLLKKLCSFVSKQAMNIDGLSEKTLKKFIDLGYVRKYKDIYTEIDKHKFEISRLSGFGEKSVSTLIESIEKSKSTTLDKVIVAFNIDGIGKETAKQLSKVIESNISDSETLYNTLIKLDGFGETLCKSVCDWFNSEDYKDFIDVLSMLNIKKDNRDKTDVLKNISFVITGKLNKFSNRDDLVNTIQNNGGLVKNSVTSKTNYLINNDITSNSGKNKKAKELNVSIISEDEFISMLNCNKFNKTKTPKKRGLF